MTKDEQVALRALTYHEPVACCATCGHQARYGGCMAVRIRDRLESHNNNPQGCCSLWKPRKEQADG